MISFKNAYGGVGNAFTITMPDGSEAIGHVLIDALGVAYSATHPILTAPAILAVTFTDRSGIILASGQTALDIPSDITRKGGSIRAGRGNAGLITVTLKDAAGFLHAEQLGPGESYALTVNGYVIQTEVMISGDTVGDTFSGVTYQ